MASFSPVDPVKLVIAVLEGSDGALNAARTRLEEAWGPIDREGPPHPFADTDYYQREMGTGLRRRILSFERLIAPEAIIEAKLKANLIEEALRSPAGRSVNLDPGYLDLHKLVLASMKYGPMKVHLGRGVYADIISRYSERAFHPCDWTFQDFKDGRYDEELLAIRTRYRDQLRDGASWRTKPP